MSLTQQISFTLNGKPVQAETPLTASVLEVLRASFELAGTKLACGEGECGACTIIVDGRSRNSCLMPAVDLAGREVLTIEGLWSEHGMDPLQQAFVDEGAIQCGFCTPGMIMQARYLLMKNPELSDEDIKRGLEGNVCRCTGYTKIIRAVARAAGDRDG